MRPTLNIITGNRDTILDRIDANSDPIGGREGEDINICLDCRHIQTLFVVERVAETIQYRDKYRRELLI